MRIFVLIHSHNQLHSSIVMSASLVTVRFFPFSARFSFFLFYFFFFTLLFLNKTSQNGGRSCCCKFEDEGKARLVIV